VVIRWWNSLRICLFVSTQYINVTDTRRTDGQTDGRTPHDSIGRAYAGIARQNGALYKWNRAKWQLNAHCIICKAKKQESSLRLIQTARIVHQPRQSELQIYPKSLGLVLGKKCQTYLILIIRIVHQPRQSELQICPKLLGIVLSKKCQRDVI